MACSLMVANIGFMYFAHYKNQHRYSSIAKNKYTNLDLFESQLKRRPRLHHVFLPERLKITVRGDINFNCSLVPILQLMPSWTGKRGPGRLNSFKDLSDTWCEKVFRARKSWTATTSSIKYHGTLPANLEYCDHYRTGKNPCKTYTLWLPATVTRKFT